VSCLHIARNKLLQSGCTLSSTMAETCRVLLCLVFFVISMDGLSGYISDWYPEGAIQQLRVCALGSMTTVRCIAADFQTVSANDFGSMTCPPGMVIMFGSWSAGLVLVQEILR